MSTPAEHQTLEQARRAKWLSSLRARAALAGFELVQMPSGDLVIGRWGGLIRALPNLEAAEAFLVQVGAPAA